MQDLTPDRATLDAGETCSRDELQALQLDRMRWSLQHAYDDVPPRMWPVAQRSLLAHVERIRSQQPGNN